MEQPQHEYAWVSGGNCDKVKITGPVQMCSPQSGSDCCCQGNKIVHLSQEDMHVYFNMMFFDSNMMAHRLQTIVRDKHNISANQK